MALILKEHSSIWQFASESNRIRQFDYLRSSFVICINNAGLGIDHDFVCQLNFYAMQYISSQPGRYRRHYDVRVDDHVPSTWPFLYDEMNVFFDNLHRNWKTWDPLEAAAFALWGINHIHPFADGNGRTARALCYYVLCLKIGQWPPGTRTMVEMMRDECREEYCAILRRMDLAKVGNALRTDLEEMATFLDELICRQLDTGRTNQPIG